MAVLINLITRAAKGAPLTTEEVDQNFLNLKQGIEESAPPGFNFVYNPATDILSINNTVSGGDLDGVEMFANLGQATMTLGHAGSQIITKGSLMVDRPQWHNTVEADDIFILKSADEEVFKVRQDGVVIHKAFTEEPAGGAVNGGVYFDGQDFWQGSPD